MSEKSLVAELAEINLAVELIELGARLHVLEAETAISRTRLIRFYKEIRGVSPPKGMLPFSTDWFVTWQPNIHSSLFYNTYLRLYEDPGCERMDAFVKAFRLYRELVDRDGEQAVLGLTRAWTLVRFFESGMLQRSRCTRCGGKFVAHAHAPVHDYVCGLCQPPSRAGKGASSHAAARRSELRTAGACSGPASG
ncbi:flagellar transcriptional regulator FlhC [Thauera aromatica]|uniref:flagellar transcriptional regulator FlhC n=1 Tax=Thauera aromatica TaxID=59405 RepID=UPI001FFC9D8E|nr:flagellar transcriptional regulator FlhC [Thauera aromatica]MCK2087647.1 flagellar transcriptional regulator FlhC [Thauera aromatica]MCK2127730.1 flagellar transcriptional regulator FlhC [Thauera aromatica]